MGESRKAVAYVFCVAWIGKTRGMGRQVGGGWMGG